MSFLKKIPVQVAIIGGFFIVIGAIISGIFSIVAAHSTKSDKVNNTTNTASVGELNGGVNLINSKVYGQINVGSDINPPAQTTYTWTNSNTYQFNPIPNGVSTTLLFTATNTPLPPKLCVYVLTDSEINSLKPITPQENFTDDLPTSTKGKYQGQNLGALCYHATKLNEIIELQLSSRPKQIVIQNN